MLYTRQELTQKGFIDRVIDGVTIYVNVIISFTGSVASVCERVIFGSMPFTLISQDIEVSEPSTAVAVIIAVPRDNAVIFPDWSTIAT